MQRLAIYSVMLMAVGVVLSACDTSQPAPTPTPQSEPTGTLLKRLVFEVTPLSGAGSVTQSQLESVQAILQKRIQVMELISAGVELSGTNALIVTIPATADAGEVSGIVIQRGFIEFLDASSNPPDTSVYIVTELGGPDPEVQPVDPSVTVYPVVLTSDDLRIGGAAASAQDGMVDLRLTTTDEGKTKLAEYTRTHTDNSMPIVLDKYVLVSPIIRDEISGGVLALAGLKDLEIRKVLASVNSGVLPVRLTFTIVDVVTAK